MSIAYKSHNKLCIVAVIHAIQMYVCYAHRFSILRRVPACGWVQRGGRGRPCSAGCQDSQGNPAIPGTILLVMETILHYCAVATVCTVLGIYMRDGKKKERSKQGQTNKQGKATQYMHPRQSPFLRKMSCLRWDLNPSTLYTHR